jgi:hypothetical protein
LQLPPIDKKRKRSNIDDGDRLIDVGNMGVAMKMMSLRGLARLLVLVPILLLGACAVGNRYDYRGAIGGLPVSGSGDIAVEVIDARPYVVSGHKSPDFVGIQRGGFGNPFDVRTASGQPLADEMRTAIASAIQGRGFTVVPPGKAAPRRLELRILEWKTDVMMRMSVQYDLTLNVFDGQGTLLASSTTKGEEILGGGFESGNSANAAKTFEQCLSTLMHDDAVKAALNGPDAK